MRAPFLQQQKWHAVYWSEVATQGPMLAGSMEFDAMQPYDSYYKHNLSHLIGYNLVTRAPNGIHQQLFKQAVAAMDNSTRDDINAHFETDHLRAHRGTVPSR